MAEKKERQRAVDPAVAALMRPTKKRRKATYDLSAETRAKVKEIAQRERFGLKQISRVAQALLDYAIADYESGEARIEMKSTPIGWLPRIVKSSSEEIDAE